MKFIPKELYTKILEVIPVPCVDMVVVNRGAFLVGKRTNHPKKGHWWIPGGRVLKGESLEQAVARKLKEELGIKKFSIKKQLWTASTPFKRSQQGPPSHTINTAYLVTVPTRELGKSDEQHGNFRWATRIEKKWDWYVKGSLTRAGFKEA